MKKKYFTTTKDIKDWIAFTKQPGHIYNKDADTTEKNLKLNKIRKLDLHGFSLIEANKIVKKFVIDSLREGYKKLLIVTGKGLRSKIKDDPYRSEKMGVLRYSVPEYLKNDKSLSSKIIKISKADLKDGGEGAMYIFLKNLKNKFR